MTSLHIISLICLALLLLGFLYKALPHISKSTQSTLSSLHSGQQAPDFTLHDQNSQPHSLSSFLGTKVALCFYPKDSSPFCTAQMCSLRDGFALLQHHNITIIGISPDSEKKHNQFKAEQMLPFLLLSDPHKKVARLYHANGGMFGSIKRITVLIDEAGSIVSILRNVDVSDHAQQIINEFVKNEQAR